MWEVLLENAEMEIVTKSRDVVFCETALALHSAIFVTSMSILISSLKLSKHYSNLACQITLQMLKFITPFRSVSIDKIRKFICTSLGREINLSKEMHTF